MIKSIIVPAVLGLTLIISAKPASAKNITPEEVVQKYFDAVVSENWELAESYWLPFDIEKSNRLGIKYTGVNIKYDANSPLISSLDKIQEGEIKYVIKKSVNFNNFSEVDVLFLVDQDSVKYKYYLVSANDQWLISAPIYICTKNWKLIETDYIRLFYSDSSLISDFALKSADQFVKNICDQMKIHPDKMQILKKNKIDYFLCNRDEMKLLTGFDANGLTNLQFDVIISQHLPHYHELIHFLINYAYKELPLYTLPILQEGLAVALGGRWGKAPDVVMQLSPIIISEKLCHLDDLLTYDGFNRILPDMSYPISGVFAGMLISNFGFDKFQYVYLSLSGTSDYVQGLKAVDIRNIFEQVYSIDWETINSQFNLYLKRFELNDLLPGNGTNGKLIMELKNENMAVSVRELEDTYDFIIKSKIQKPAGVIFFNKYGQSFDSTYKSRLFSEQFPNIEYSGFEYGLKFDNNEVGLYNYLTNCLEAKYVAAFSPSEKYWDKDSKTISFNIQKSVFDFELLPKDTTQIELLIP